MKIKAEDFRVREGAKVKLRKWPTEVKRAYASGEDYERQIGEQCEKLGELQSLLYAHSRYALLLIFQAMDAAGKDSAIKHVMRGVNPQGCQVYSFKSPSSEELAHDFLWRTTCRLPERGRIGIFNRSYYEEVLIVKVHPEILQARALPPEALADKNIWRHRYQSISSLEQHLHHNGTRIMKFYLHVSKEEQRQRFLARIDEPEKNWKFSQADLKERARWDDYRRAYEDCISATSTGECPWYIIPADDKENARLIISRLIIGELKSLRMSYPEPDAKARDEFKQLRSQLEG